MAVNTITGTTGNDLLQGQQLSGTQNLINGLAGNDTLIAATVSDSLNGGAGNDSLSFGTGLTINGAALVGGLGADSFYANGQTLLAASYEGNSGADLFSFTAAANISSTSIRGGEGNDTLVTLTGAAVSYNGFVATFGQGADVMTVGTGAAIVNTLVFGGKDNDTLSFGGSVNASTLGANEGADRIFLVGTAITLTNSLLGAGKGHDVITNTAGNGQLISTLGTLVGGEGFDTIRITSQSALSNFQFWGDTLAGGSDSTVGLADLITISANGAGAAGIYASIYGGAGNDTLALFNTTAGAGTGAALNMFGGQGNDSINVSVGAHTLRGGAGNDTLVGNFTFTAGGAASAAFLNLNGGAGVDQLIFNNAGTGQFVGIAGNSAQDTNQFSAFNVVAGSFTDSGDQLVLSNFGPNGTATFSAINILNSAGNVAYTGGGSIQATYTGKFAYNISNGFSSVAIAGNSGFTVGSVNVFESNGDTVVQMLFGVMTAAVGSTANFGGLLTARNNLSTANVVSFYFSGNTNIIGANVTAGFLGSSAINLNFDIYSTAAAGRNGFTITLA